MAKQQRGSNRTPNRPATPAASNRPSGQRPSTKSSGNWQPNRVSASKKKSGPNRTALYTVVAVIVGLVIVGFVALNQLGGSKTGGSSDALNTPGGSSLTPTTIPVNGRTLGDPNAPVTIDLYGDFRCSACFQFTEMGTAHQIDTNLIATGKAKLVWHDFTIIDHNDGATASRDAANAAWCAADQNKFWTMHDWLYANQSPTEAPDAFTIDRLLKIGEAAGMDMTTFTPCVKNGTHDAEIASEQASLPSGITGTPSTVVNGTLVNATYDAVKTAVDAAIGGSASPAASSPAASAPAASSPATAAPASPSPS
jgi:protein-disulfide isomerase